MITDADVGGLLGEQLRQASDCQVPIVSVDGIEIQSYDFVDIGQVDGTSGVVPVVVKSLIFPHGGPPGHGSTEVSRHETMVEGGHS